MAEGRMKPYDINRGREIASSWKLAFSLTLLFSLPHTQAASPSVYYMNLTLHWGKRAMSEVYQPALLEGNFPSKKMMGVLVNPEGETKYACSQGTTFSVPPDTETWIAFIARGGCTFKDKIKAAVGKGAAGVIIYDYSSPKKEILILTREDAGDVAAVMITSLKGKQILRLIQKGIRVTAVIEVGTTQCFWKIYLSAYSLILTLVAYIVLCCRPGQVLIRHEERRAQATDSEVHRAVHLLELRKLKRGDREIAEETCAVCLEAYKPRQIVRVLTCKHVFHRKCIDRWLRKRRICPMCNCAIIQKK